MVHGEFSKLNSANTGDHILHRPLAPQDIEKLHARRTNVDTVGDRIRDLVSIQVVEKLFALRHGTHSPALYRPRHS